MTWSYTENSDNPKDRVRVLIGDTDVADPLLEDEEIQAVLGLSDNNVSGWYLAAGDAAEAVAAKYARKITQSAGPINSSLSQIFDHYMALAERLRKSARGSNSSASRLQTTAYLNPPGVPVWIEWNMDNLQESAPPIVANDEF